MRVALWPRPNKTNSKQVDAELNTYVLLDVPEGRNTGPRIFERADARSARAVFIFSSSGSGAYSGYDPGVCDCHVDSQHDFFPISTSSRFQSKAYVEIALIPTVP
jgi:hypothetical protein